MLQLISSNNFLTCTAVDEGDKVLPWELMVYTAPGELCTFLALKYA